jgi:aminomethyltransferase
MADALRRTSLHDRHVGAGARLGPFAGWEMPLSYAGTTTEHLAVRSRAGVFDVSHMGQLEVSGPGALPFLQRMLTNDVERLLPGRGQYTLLLREDGGIIDDLIVYALVDRLMLVVNAANREACFAWLADHEPGGVELYDRSDEIAMLALQGRDWRRLVEAVAATPAPLELDYFDITEDVLAGAPAFVARTGYTGEPGVEILCPWDAAATIWDALQAQEDPPEPAGLVARDTLRLEMGYPLHGNDIGLDRTPIEAGLGWACALDTEFTGVDVLRRRTEEGPAERLTAFRLTEPGIPRAGHAVLHDDRIVGAVSSGTISPSLDLGIGMAYLPAQLAAPGTSLRIDIRGKMKSAATDRAPLVDASPRKG